MTVCGEQKREAANYLKKLNVKAEAIEAFEKAGTVYILDGTYFTPLRREGKLFYKISEIELADRVKIYGVIFSQSYFGLLINFLAVSPYPEDWERTVRKERGGRYRAYAYVWNTDAPELSEFGSIVVEEKGGYLERVF